MAIVPGFATALTLSVVKAVAALRVAMENRRQARQLLDWDHRALKDIGLTRSDVRGALSLPFNDDPTQHLSLIAAGRDNHARSGVSGRPMVSPLGTAGKDRSDILPSVGPVACT